jgi:hypothetical protein
MMLLGPGRAESNRLREWPCLILDRENASCLPLAALFSAAQYTSAALFSAGQYTLTSGGRCRYYPVNSSYSRARLRAPMLEPQCTTHPRSVAAVYVGPTQAHRSVRCPQGGDLASRTKSCAVVAFRGYERHTSRRCSFEMLLT